MKLAKRLSRLSALYATVERVKEAELLAAAARAGEVDGLCREAAVSAQQLGQQQRAALLLADRAELAVLCSAAQAQRRQANRLEASRQKSAAQRDLAAVEHQASRVQAEQMQRLSTRSNQLAAGALNKREQTDADDRYGARLARRAR